MSVKREYSFVYMGQEVHAGSKIVFRGEYFDIDGTRHYKEYWPCIFKYVEDGKFYIDVDGKLCYHKNLDRKIHRFMVLNGKKIANPATEDDVRAAFILLLIVMAATSIFKCNFAWWAFEIMIYYNYANSKKYT